VQLRNYGEIMGRTGAPDSRKFCFIPFLDKSPKFQFGVRCPWKGRSFIPISKDQATRVQKVILSAEVKCIDVYVASPPSLHVNATKNLASPKNTALSSVGRPLGKERGHSEAKLTKVHCSITSQRGIPPREAMTFFFSFLI